MANVKSKKAKDEILEVIASMGDKVGEQISEELELNEYDIDVIKAFLDRSSKFVTELLDEAAEHKWGTLDMLDGMMKITLVFASIGGGLEPVEKKKPEKKTEVLVGKKKLTEKQAKKLESLLDEMGILDDLEN